MMLVRRMSAAVALALGRWAVRAVWRLGWVASVSAALLLTLGGCDLLGHRVSIPPGAAVGHVVISRDTLTLDPSSMPSGDVYLTVEGPSDALGFVTSAKKNGWPPAPLTDADIARLTSGDRQGFMFAYGMVSEDGIVKLPGLLPGKYALILEAHDSQPRVDPSAIVILTVLP